jgi:hypothetical protein
MTFASIPSGARVFLDANTLVYHFVAHPQFGVACTAAMHLSPSCIDSF